MCIRDSWNTGSVPANGSPIYFDGLTGNVNGNDITGASFSGLTFNSTASAFTLGCNPVTITANVTDLSGNTETLNLGIILGSPTIIFNGTAGTMNVNGVVSDGGLGYGVDKVGAGTVFFNGTNTYLCLLYTSRCV